MEYLDEKNYLSSGYSPKRNKKKLKTLDDIKKVSTSIYTKDPTLHYKNNHNHIPPWILFKNITFNLSIDLFSFLQKDEKEEVVNDYKSIISLEISEKKQFVKNAITIIRKFRNKIAHNAKIVTYTVEDNELDPTHLKKIFNPEIYGENEQNDKLGKNDIFSMVLALCIILENKILIVSFLNEINILFSTIDDTSSNYIKCLNLPKDFKKKIGLLIEYFMSRRG